MAEKRMFSKAVIDSDIFLDMPLTAQALYFHMAMRADDDGFIDNPKKIQRMVGATDDDFRFLIENQFIITFESGIIAIKHWKLHNYIRLDRYKPTIHQAEKAQISTDESRVYTVGIPSDIPVVDEWSTVGIPSDIPVVDKRSTIGIPGDIPVVDKWYAQYRLDKNSIDKNSIEIGESMRGEQEAEPPRPPKNNRRKYGLYKNVFLSDGELEELKNEFPKDYEKRIERLGEYIESTGKTYKNHLATIRSWSRKESTSQNESGKKWSGTDDPSPGEILGI